MKFVVLMLTVLSLTLPARATGPDPEFDRLDGTGKSGARINVIEWEGNLEIHSYPRGNLRGLALKLDQRNKDKPVLVIGYRFENAPTQQLIRRAILGINLREGFKTFQDASDPEMDKVVISNNGLALAAFKLEPAPTQLYPEGHPLNKATSVAANQPHLGEPSRAPASAEPEVETAAQREFEAAKAARGKSRDAEKAEVDENGTIQPFFSGPSRKNGL